MANRYTQQATKQVGGAYDSQIKDLQSQVPAIQKLYQTLSQGLQGQFSRQLESGVEGIGEDAAGRGIARSTIPVNARTTLTAQLGEALQSSLGNLNVQQGKDIGGIKGQIGQLGINRSQSIAERANQLRNSDLEDRRFNYQKEQDKIANDLERQRISAARSNARNSGGSSRKSAFALGGSEGGGYTVFNSDGSRADIDLWTYVRSEGGGVADLVGKLANGDDADRAAARQFNINLAASGNPQKAFKQLISDRPTAFYTSGLVKDSGGGGSSGGGGGVSTGWLPGAFGG